MGTGKHNQKNSPRISFGGKPASQVRKSASQPRAWWHWGLLIMVIAGIIGFILQMMFSDPAKLSLGRLQFLIGYAAVLFISSAALGIVEWKRFKSK
jgi:hypothetical protein